MSMETDIRAKKNESKLKSLIEWGPVNTPTENFPKTSIRELAEKVEAMSGPQDHEVDKIIMDMAKKLKRHNEVLVLMAEALEKFEEKLKKPSERRKPRKHKTKRKRAA